MDRILQLNPEKSSLRLDIGTYVYGSSGSSAGATLVTGTSRSTFTNPLCAPHAHTQHFISHAWPLPTHSVLAPTRGPLTRIDRDMPHVVTVAHMWKEHATRG